MTTLTITRASQSVQEFVPKTQPPPPPVPGLDLAVVLHDYDLYKMSRPTWKKKPKTGNHIVYGLPETVKAGNSKFMKLTEAWQWYWFGLLKLSAPGLSEEALITAWNSLTRSNCFITNGKGWDNKLANYPAGLYLDKPPMMFETIVTGGAWLEILHNRQVFSSWKGDMYKYRMLDGNLNPPALDGSIRSTTVYWATISRRDRLPNDIWREDRVIPFQQLGGLDVPTPVMGNGTEGLIPVERIRFIDSAQPWPSPYVR